MKTTCLTLGLLLLTVFHSYAVPLGLDPSPASCCFTFSKMTVPVHRIVSIKRTDKNCLLPAFIVTTVKNRVICFQSGEQWVQKAFRSLHHPAAVTRRNPMEGSSHV